VSETPPPTNLRARVLAMASAEPVSSRAGGARRRTLAVAGGFAVPVVLSLCLGGPSTGGRPVAYVATLAMAWLTLGLAATWGGVSRGRSMLGRSASTRFAIAVLTPAALLATSLVAAMVWPQTLVDDATMNSHVVCVVFTLLCALGPLAAFAVIRRRSDPVAPRLTGAAIGVASGAWGALAIEMHCGHASPAHIVLGHVLPVVMLTLVGVLVGDRVVAIHARSASR
jgi:hypothetical protein